MAEDHAQPPRREPASPVPSATVLLVRDGSAGLEVFMIERHPRADFATGALVFPGGKVEPADADAGVRSRARGGAVLSDAELALRAAAVRETFEECGVLLACPRGSAEPVPAQRLGAIEARHGAERRAHRLRLPVLLEAEDLEMSCERLVPFAHWITPEFMPRRFDTHFFLVAAPPDQVAAHDGSESVDSLWVTPAAAVAEREARRRTIIFPTLLNLRRLGRSRSVAEALEAARRAPPVTVLPKVVRTDAGPRVRIPAEAGYDVVEAAVEDL
jgi:8-oxo-dGTP pyrophosphatase MutT (NUDIX family)